MMIDLAPPRPAARPAGASRSLAELCEPGGAALGIAAEAPLARAIEMFRQHPALRLLAVLDEGDRPVGAILEEDIRAILYNPFGHSLLMNPSFARTAGSHARLCPIADADTELGALLDLYARAGGSEGLLLTDHGRFRGILANPTLIRLAGRREAELATARADHYERAAAAGRMFLADIDRLVDDLGVVADAIEETAGSTIERVARFQNQSERLADASRRTEDGMSGLADHGARLAATIRLLGDDAAAARASAAEAVGLSEAGRSRSSALGEAAREIDDNLSLIQTIAAQAHRLAINAAIEAARIGEKGGGFAVVARELRQFAAQTRGAVATIAERIGHVRAISRDMGSTHAAVETIVRGVDTVSRSVGSAATAEAESARILAETIERVTQASGATHAIVSENHGLIAQAAAGAAGLSDNAETLIAQAARLRARVDGFLGEMRVG